METEAVSLWGRHSIKPKNVKRNAAFENFFWRLSSFTNNNILLITNTITEDGQPTPSMNK